MRVAEIVLLYRYLRIIPAVFFLLLPVASYALQFEVIRVIDGDTITVISDGKQTKIHLVGIDAPELSKIKHIPGQPFSLKAKERLAALIQNKTVTIKSYGKQRGGHSLGEVFLGGINVNLEMVKAGLAEVNRGKPTKGLAISTYRNAEKDAKDKAVGIWELRDQYFSPMDWREMYELPE